MEKQIETLQQQLKQQEKLASLGMLSAGIAHEIQNPLNFVINFSKMSEKLLKDLTEIVEDNEDKLPADDREEIDDIVADLKENMEKIVEHGERAISIIQGILLVSRGKENEMLPADINHIVKEYVWLSYHALRANHKGFNVSIVENYQPDIPKMMVIPQDLSRAVLNLMNNACYTVWNRSQKEGEDYKPTISVKTSFKDNQIEVSIADNGEGMSSEVVQRLYENFFTTKPIGQGTGLGMGITRDIIENKHGGHLTFESEVGKGTCFTFTIPAKKP
ncbi:His Kinase A (phospho-acceptor) domain-containing protein [Prevotella sp. tc2-28]|jgi:signal transduction histidine kinase|uniref:sensor histidine kinase n=1 Tax=Prevotella sp. tc2-28 TaxID=1761888 RepID=UPI000895CBD4|nr:HAMP domain-containing sensor histidine kinase [Prevotella sp. tc2-28]SEA21514.1 His Kinase A (phospho-acceptor) domain-containing protein [Prevotella sp. tc2-28]